MIKCIGPENIHSPPTERIGNSWGLGGSQTPNNLSKCMKLDWNFQRGGEWVACVADALNLLYIASAN